MIQLQPADTTQPGWIMLSAHPELQVERVAAPSTKALALFWGTLTVLGLWLVLLLAGALGST